ncbi:GDP-D-glucose phosphorylase 1 [Erpetoichthys calabaricus]|uniref:GDP-D-glucose phosphorylase 1 n=1 Tax=Erpetoichthys calabaricus TaxID=27687 RepID=UPI002234E0E3|nr:GDP-D-glucose phosphorylase 1 [Erpetoichthys calabaricus]
MALPGEDAACFSGFQAQYIKFCNGDTSVYIFTYAEEDFIRGSAQCLDDDALSRFDKILRSKWQEKMERGFFKYHLGELQTRILPGSRHFVAQLNIQRGALRRKPQEIQSIKQVFDPSQFNFNKIKSGEILFEIQREGHCRRCDFDYNGVICDKILFVINVSPLEFCHSLIVPYPELCLPQILTMDAIRIGIESVLLSSDPGFRVGFNSLGAFASVNHLHLHCYYLNHRLLLEGTPAVPLSPHHNFYFLPDFPPGFLFYTDGDDLERLVDRIWKITQVFVEKDIAHNMFITRGCQPDHHRCDTFLVRSGIRIVLWPRMSCFGAKEESAFNVALCELAGHLPFKNRKDFESTTEETVIQIIKKYLLPENQFFQLQSELLKVFDTQEAPSSV